MLLPSVDSKYDPSYIGMDAMCMATVDACDPDIRKELYGQVIMAGGNTLYPGLTARLQKEVRRHVDGEDADDSLGCW